MAAVPDVPTVRTRLGIAASTSDEELQEIVEAEVLNQARRCRVPGEQLVDADQLRALYRRIARECAAKSIPLGLVGGDLEFGPTRLPQFDAEIERLERPTRIVVFG